MAKVQFPIGGNISVGSHDWVASVTGQGADLYFVSRDRGSNDNDGRARDTAVRTWQKAVDLATDNRLTVILGEPGTYPENLNVNKRRIALIGDPRHPGATSIDGDGGTTLRATIYVGDGFASGFTMANLSAGTGGTVGTAAAEIARPVIHIVTNDTAAGLTAESADYYWHLENIHIVGGTTPLAALYLEGASMGRVFNSTFAGCVYGIALGGSLNNFPNDLLFDNIIFYNNVRADVGSVSSNAVNGHPTLLNAATLGSVEAVLFDRCKFMDVGGTPVTNYVNLEATTALNVMLSDARFARDVADGTLMQLATNIVVLGHSPAGLESFVAA